MPCYNVESLDDPRLDPYRGVTRSNLTQWSGRFIAEGRRVVRRLLASDFTVESVLVSDRRYPALASELGAAETILLIPQRLAESLVGYNFHCGVLACGLRKPPLTLSDIAPASAGHATIVVCPRITGPENLGGIIRLCMGFGVNGLLLGMGSGDPFSRRVLRVSMGSVFRLPIARSRDLTADLQSLHDEYGFELAAAILDSRAESLERAGRPERFGLLFGHESDGLDPQLLELCQRRVTIAMEHDTDSLNVATAAGICLHHFMRVV